MTLPHLLETEQADAAHEALRIGFHQALADLQASSVGMSEFRLALQSLATLAASYAAALPASVTDRQSLHDTDTAIMQTLASLALRVISLENKPAVRNVATAAPVSLGLLSIGSRDVTLQWDRTLPDANYEPEYWPSPGLLGSVSLVTKTKTTTGVVVTVRTTSLVAAGGSLGAIAVRTV